MPRHHGTGGSSRNSPPAKRSTISAILCSRRGIIITIAASLVVYCVVFRWSASQTGGIGILNGEQTIHESVNPNNKLHRKAASLRVLDPISQEFEQRKRLYEEKCNQRNENTNNNHHYVGELFHYPPSKLSVCHVPKAGCTFWKRLFRYLYTEHKRTDISSLFDIDRAQAHFGPQTSLPIYDFQSPEGRLLVDASTKVMMVRSPYRRLWSAYVDKFLLPEWWLDHGKAIMFGRKDSAMMKDCPDDISFEEFLEYSLRNHERHWRPITELCDPCTYRPKFIGHVDTTFMRDVGHILTSQGLGSLLTEYKKEEHLPYDIKNLVDYHYQLLAQRLPLHDCVSQGDLASMLWQALQLNGYYKMDHVFPQQQIEAALNGSVGKQARNSVVEIFLREFHQDPITEQAWRLQREVVFEEAYRNVSDVTKDKIAQRYHDDFDMFGFDPTFPGGSKWRKPK